MEEQNKEIKLKKLEEALHNKSPLPSLRTYQGDMAEFIREKNESVISVAVKEKVREEKRGEKIKKEEGPKPKSEGLQVNLAALLSSVLLIAGGTMAFFYVFDRIKNVPESEPIIQNEIVPYDRIITLANVTKETLGAELGNIGLQNGISIIKLSDNSGNLVATSKNLLNFLKIFPPAALVRNLKDEYAIGVVPQDNKNTFFIVIKTNDFASAFASMLDWEKTLYEDLSFLAGQTEEKISTTTATISKELIWRDAILKNKDIRVLVDENYRSQIAYTFLDKNTILITGNIYAIGDLSSAYTSRIFTR